MGRPTALSLDEEAMVFGLLSMYQPKTREYRAMRLQLAARFGLTELSIENIERRHRARVLASEKARAPSNGDTGRTAARSPRLQMQPDDTTAPEAEGNGDPSTGGCDE